MLAAARTLSYCSARLQLRNRCQVARDSLPSCLWISQPRYCRCYRLLYRSADGTDEQAHSFGGDAGSVCSGLHDDAFDDEPNYQIDAFPRQTRTRRYRSSTAARDASGAAVKRRSLRNIHFEGVAGAASLITLSILPSYSTSGLCRVPLELQPASRSDSQKCRRWGLNPRPFGIEPKSTALDHSATSACVAATNASLSNASVNRQSANLGA